jgi:hypothetical protein
MGPEVLLTSERKLTGKKPDNIGVRRQGENEKLTSVKFKIAIIDVGPWQVG